MAVTLINRLIGVTRIIFDVEATANGDTTTGDVAHGLGDIPLEATLLPLQPSFYQSRWRITTLDAINVVLTKAPGAGTGVPGPQVRCSLSLPHSIVK